MEKIEINKTFKSLDECNEWQKTHLNEYLNDKTLVLVMHESSTISGDITITYALVC